jgi:hypothetical protein
MKDNVGGCSRTFDSIGCSKRGGFKVVVVVVVAVLVVEVDVC